MSSKSCQSAAVSRTTGDATKTPNAPTCTSKVGWCWQQLGRVFSVGSRSLLLCFCADATLGVFHLRSDQGQYKLTLAAAQQACSAEGGGLATYSQLSYAQQVSKRTTAAPVAHGGS